MIKKLPILFIAIGILFGTIGIAQAGFFSDLYNQFFKNEPVEDTPPGYVSQPSYFKKTGNSILFINSSWDLHNTSTPINVGHFSGINLGGTFLTSWPAGGTGGDWATTSEAYYWTTMDTDSLSEGSTNLYQDSELTNWIDDAILGASGDLTVVNATTTGSMYISDDLTVDGDVVSDADSTDDLGSSDKYWKNTYTDKLYLNSTATLDGATAGVISVVGNVGIGTTDPNYKLEVQGTASTTQMYLGDGIGTSAGSFLAVDGDGLIIATSTPTASVDESANYDWTGTHDFSGGWLSATTSLDYWLNSSTTIQTHFDNADTAYGWGDHSSEG